MRKRNFYRMLFLLGAWIFGLSMYAQESRLVSGRITDTDGEPLPGVNIIIRGTTNGTVSDFDGNYSLEVSNAPGAVLTFRFIGFKEKEVAVGTQSTINVSLESSSIGLEEVVAIGYGTVKKRDITGSVASVSGEALQAIPVASAAEAITGKLAGVQITTTEGSPDAEMKIRVRGGGSITGDNTPLLIVDGFPVETISDIAPSDIESIDVLKDASSTAIYGSRGANGVIIITTKRGAEGKVSVNYNAYAAWKKMANKLDVLDSYDYVKWQYERAQLAGEPEKYTDYFGNYQDMDLYKEVNGNDWQDQVFGRTGFTFNHNLSITGGNDKTAYAFNYGHIDDKAIMQMSSYKRDNLTLKLTNRPHKKVKLDFSIRYSDIEIEGGGANEQNEVSSADSRLKYAMIYPPFPVPGLTDNDEEDQTFSLYHPVQALADNDRLQKRKSYNMNGSASWEMIDNLTIKTDVGLDDYRRSDDRFYGVTTYYVKDRPDADYKGMPAIEFDKQERQTFRNTNTVNYSFDNLLAAEHRLSVLVGQEYIIRKQEEHTTIVHGFPMAFTFDDARSFSAQGKAHSIENYLSPDDVLLSYFGRTNYSFQDKYLLSATFRADGSSKFSKDNRWGYFPSAAVAWRITSEPFMDGVKTWLDDLKLRLSYGTAGNNNIPSGQLVQTLEVKTTNYVDGYDSYWAASKTMANPDLKWETTITRNIGLDYTILSGRLNGSLELYRNTTEDLLIQFLTPGSGYDNQYRNMGETQNQGLEVSVNWIALDLPDFGLSFSGNIGFNRNKIVSLGLMDSFTGTSGWASSEIGADYYVTKDGSVGAMYGYLNDGRYEVDDFEGYIDGVWVLKDGVVDSSPIVGTVRPGTMKLKNAGGDETIVDADDRTIIGDANPLNTGGLTINARAYGFDLSAAFNWSYGNDVYNANKIEYTSTSKYHSRNMITTMADGKRWTNLLSDGTISNDPVQLAEMNQNTTMWSPYMSRFVFSDWAVEDGSFLRLNTLTLGYTLPSDLVKRVGISNLRFYASGYNLWLWTNYSGFDPEVSTRRKTQLTPGVDYSAYPKSRSFVVGMNLTF
ncbi:SusC/RagA family TonB-linked outer membrane protein [Geofilum sp. OHC36d9]|uniref:SusC/RagA family TonB-linked outer membrane protein n=1 Tax=Geofilum sp. OHC36d9 TaxID=3458413 RepID=UPI004034D898